MRLYELFANPPLNVSDNLLSSLLDVLTPLVASGIEFVTVDHIIDELRSVRSGVNIDRTLVMTILDPTKVALIKEIKGDKVYLSLPMPPEMAQNEIEAEKDQAKMASDAAKQAEKTIKKKSPALPKAKQKLPLPDLKKPKLTPPKIGGGKI